MPKTTFDYPLGAFGGTRPVGPEWFDAAITVQPERAFVTIEGAAIETLSWGNSEAPGVMLVHGYSANAGWWRHIAPLLANDHHVVAMSWSGMGGSDWRDVYDSYLTSREIEGAMRAHGMLDDGRKPLVVAHSMGGAPSLIMADRLGEALAGVMTLDSPLRLEPRPRGIGEEPVMRHRGYPDLPAALARFRYMPPPRHDAPWIADLFARQGLVERSNDDGTSCWEWRFDPNALNNTEISATAHIPANLRCPLVVTIADYSDIITPDWRAEIACRLRPDQPLVFFEDCSHQVLTDQPLHLVETIRNYGKTLFPPS